MKKLAGLVLLTSALAWAVPILSAQALTLGDSSQVLGDTTSGFNPYPPGTLVLDDGGIYLINGNTKVGFSNWQAFSGLGFSLKNVVEGDLTNYTLSSYTISTANGPHPYGTWIIYRGTVYYVAADGLIGVPSSAIFTSNGGNWSYIVKANKYDVALLNRNPNLPTLTFNDPRIYGKNNQGGGNPNQSVYASPSVLSFTAVAGGSTPAMQSFTIYPSQAEPSWTAMVQSMSFPGLNLSYSNSVGAIVTGSGTASVNVSVVAPFTVGKYTSDINIASGGKNYTVKVYLSVSSAIVDYPNMTPSTPTMTGPTSVQAGHSNNYYFSATDITSNGYNGGDLKYTIDWGDGSTTYSPAAFPSGIGYNTYHTWATNGIYNITVTAIPGLGKPSTASFGVKVSVQSTGDILSVYPTSLTFDAITNLYDSPQTLSLSGVSGQWIASVSPMGSWLRVNGGASGATGVIGSTVINVSDDTTNLSPGTYNGSITISSYDSPGRFSPITIPVTLHVNAAGGNLSITTPSMPDGSAGQNYSQQFYAVGGVAPYTWTIYTTTHPCCYVGINQSTGLLSSNLQGGQPPLAGTWQMGVQVTDAYGQKSQKLYTWKVNPVSGTAGSFSLSQLSFDFDVNVGDSSDHLASMNFTNLTGSTIMYKISVPNQPAWLNASYTTDQQLAAYPSTPNGIGASINAANLPIGTYSSYIVISGSFSGSPLVIPVNLRVNPYNPL